MESSQCIIIRSNLRHRNSTISICSSRFVLSTDNYVILTVSKVKANPISDQQGRIMQSRCLIFTTFKFAGSPH